MDSSSRIHGKIGPRKDIPGQQGMFWMSVELCITGHFDLEEVYFSILSLFKYKQNTIKAKIDTK